MTPTPSTRASLLLRLRDPQDHEAWVEFVASRSIDRWDPSKERGSFRGWLRRVTRNLVINWLKHRDRRVVGTGGSGLQAMLDMLPAAAGPETVEFDRELRRALFQRAAEQVRREVHSATWQAFWETSIVGTTSADAAKKLGMAVGAIRVAKCRVLARLHRDCPGE